MADELVWDGVSTYLAPGATGRRRSRGRRPDRQVEPLSPIAIWRLPADLGRDYRRVSGDPNPIHTSALAARAFGFARPIIHGMWTHARLLAALEAAPARRPTRSRSTSLRPILLPAKVGAWWHRHGDGWRAAVTDRDGTLAHLVASVTA